MPKFCGLLRIYELYAYSIALHQETHSYDCFLAINENNQGTSIKKIIKRIGTVEDSRKMGEIYYL